MQVLEYLNSGKTLNDLSEEFGIKVSENENLTGLYCLNYCQINSPKEHPIVRECRSLVLKQVNDRWVVSSRSFDRFFNLGEIEGEEHDINDLVAFEKVDGSLIGIWYDADYGWLYRTRSMIVPEDMSINGHDITWSELIERNVGDLSNLQTNCTYICEIVSKWNRVVTKYDEESMYLLAVRYNGTGKYASIGFAPNGWKPPNKYSFNTIDQCVKSAKELPNLEEGYVLYNHSGQPVVKVKSPAYVAAHKLRGEGTPSPKRIMDLVIENEQDEYLAIFPEDTEMFEPYTQALKIGLDIANKVFSEYNSTCSDQKEFALKVKDLYYAPLLFSARSKGGKPSDYFYKLTRQGQYRFIENTVEGIQCQN